MGTWLTADEYRTAPTAVGTKNLVSGGTADAQTAELNRVIRRAGAWIDNYVNQPMLAGSVTETLRVRANRYGEFAFTPRVHSSRLVAMTSFKYGSAVNALASLSDLTAVWTQDGAWRVPVGASVMTIPSIQLTRLAPGDEWICQYTYTYGYTSTVLTSSPAAGATSFTISDGTAVAAGKYTLWDADLTEDVTVTNVVGNTVTCTALTSAHNAGAGFSNLPDDLKQAAILVTSAMIKSPRGSDAVTASNAQPTGPVVGADPVGAMNMRMAREILIPYQKKR